MDELKPVAPETKPSSLTREDLCKLLWSQPMRDVAATYGFSCAAKRTIFAFSMEAISSGV